MRLLNKGTLNVETFISELAPPYIILSHQWRGAETTLQEFSEQKSAPEQEWSDGTAKVMRFCREVASYSEQYVWIDTCCIDKASSAELQEAINSMYQWYEDASTCLVYLDDVNLSTVSAEGRHISQQLADCRWFSRGWTLQELLAPVNEVFLDRNWQRIGTRSELAESISHITGIRPACLGNRAEIFSTTVAERMSWMSTRQTTRVEDLAYCMLGLFDVNMTMLYGEGSKAFRRLQREIIQELDDESIFVWQPPERGNPLSTNDDNGICTLPILAPHPSCFSFCRTNPVQTDVFFAREPYRITTQGLEIETFGTRSSQFGPELPIYLNCTVNGERAVLNLRQHSNSRHAGRIRWQRVRTEKFATVQEGWRPTPVTDWGLYNQRLRELRMKALSKPWAATWSASWCEEPIDGLGALHYETESIRFFVYVQ